MVKRWLLYLVALLGCLVFFAAYQGWIAWILLVMVVLLPVFSLAVSLAAMVLPKGQIRCPGAVTIGQEAELEVLLTSPLPLPPSRCCFSVTHSLTGETLSVFPNDPLPTEHCGQLVCTSEGIYLYDFLGLFRIKRKLPGHTMLIRPKPIQTEPPRDLERQISQSWHPKYGGGFSEHHELRLYRPGDGLNQVHWKLSAKTGKLIVREPMIPKCGRLLLTVDLAGQPQELDRRLGQLLWMGRHLLDMELGFELHALTGSGHRTHRVTTEAGLNAAVDDLLCCRPATAGTARNRKTAAFWQYHIGGDADEA